MSDSTRKADDYKNLVIAQHSVMVYQTSLLLASRLLCERHHYVKQKELTAFRAYYKINRIS